MVRCTARVPSGFEREVGTPPRERGRPGPADAHYLMITLCCCLLRAVVPSWSPPPASARLAAA